ncbi:MAG: hypothetical protein P1P81_10500, partial [Desulfobulbales bacterium]|nr:hypothetical protein [Desulfobulbales bacterium]
MNRQDEPGGFIPTGRPKTICFAAHKFRLHPIGHESRRAAQLSFIPQGHKFRLSRRAAQLSF